MNFLLYYILLSKCFVRKVCNSHCGWSLCKFALQVFNLRNCTSKCLIILYTIVSKDEALKLTYIPASIVLASTNWFFVWKVTPLGWGHLFFSNLYLRFIPPINLWKDIHLRLFSKCLAELFLRPLRSKDVWGWILRFQPENFFADSKKKCCQPWQCKADRCITNSKKVLIYLSLLSLLLHCSKTVSLKKIRKEIVGVSYI